ncbi:hypothetical protein F751_0786 [Auxenochlorella protothecoides]|uniref:Uncharacterized protein n=1 Tax=Auxenochlorella protothecoides TaxID=3075 RepID=A0A087SS08_AUXPR|nr:hypothetical protein F751_0786 [Auxenochlorella protothecoides]KFM28512.1 hypothetical protein F751_0786 [Auxenochlorella protothecoides]
MYLTEAELHALGLPLALCITPLGTSRSVPTAQPAPRQGNEGDGQPRAPGRCGCCGAYVCAAVGFRPEGWVCALCGEVNDFSRGDNWRYMPGPDSTSPAPLPGLDASPAATDLEQTGAGAVEVDCRPMLLALVDVGGPAPCVAASCAALLAGVEAAPAGTLFVLMTYAGEEQEAVFCADNSAGQEALRPAPLRQLAAGVPPARWLLDLEQDKEIVVATLEELELAHSAPASPGRQEAPAPADVAGTLSLVTCALEAHAPTIAALRSTDPAALLDTRPGALACSRLLFFAARVPTSGAGAVIGVVQPPLMMPLDRGDLDDDTSTRASAPPPPAQSLPGLDAGHPELTAWGDAGDEETPPPTPVAVDPGVPLAPGLREVCPGVALAYAPAHSVPYAALGAELAAQGVVLDLFALGPHFLGLYALAPAAEVTGGAVYRYPDPLSSRLAQDVCKRIASRSASDCLLRLRCSPGLCVAASLNAALTPVDRDSDGLWQAAAAHPGTTWAVELGFQGGKMRQPAAFQTAFQYLALVAQEPGAGCDGRRAGVCAWSWRLQRRLRICTLVCSDSAGASLGPGRPSPPHALPDVDPAAVAAVLTQQAIRALPGVGREALEAALADWLRALAASLWKRGLGPASHDGPSWLQALLQGLHALLRALHGLQPHGDADAVRRALWASLWPPHLLAALYPRLSSWDSHEAEAFERHSLSRLAMVRGTAALEPFLQDDEGLRSDDPGVPLAALCHVSFLRALQRVAVHA